MLEKQNKTEIKRKICFILYELIKAKIPIERIISTI